MQWSNAYATGVQHLDDQHKTIFQLAESYRTSVDAGEGRTIYGPFLEFLDRYIRSHFEFEEQCMEQYRGTVTQQNKAAHAELVPVVAQFRQRFQAEGFEPVHARALVDAVDQWLEGHIRDVDVQLKQHVKAT